MERCAHPVGKQKENAHSGFEPSGKANNGKHTRKQTNKSGLIPVLAQIMHAVINPRFPFAEGGPSQS